MEIRAIFLDNMRMHANIRILVGCVIVGRISEIRVIILENMWICANIRIIFIS